MGKDRNIILAILFVDLVLLSAVITVYYYILLELTPDVLRGISGPTSVLSIFTICYLASYAFNPSILQKRMVNSEDIAKRVISTCVFMLLFITLTTSLARPYEHFPRKFLFSSLLIFSVFLFIERILMRKLLMHARSQKKNTKSVVFIGNDPTITKLFNMFKTPTYGYNILGAFFNGECDNEELTEKRIGGVEDVYSWIANNNNVDEIYGYLPKENQEFINMISKFCDNHMIRFYYVPAIDIFSGNMAFSQIENIPVVAKREEPLSNPFNKFIKRSFDLIFSSIVLLFIFPWVWLFVAIMIKIKSPGPIFFKQERTGVDGKIFKCIKFRSMKVNDQADKLQATKDDPRKFPFGDFMRKTNIDEMPQFINVFKGEMSIVGPRPHMLKHTEEYSKLINRFMVRHLAKPGITGLAQVSGFRGETKYIDQMEGRVNKDIEYIENWTFLLDMKIIVKTITNVIFRQEKGNAY